MICLILEILIIIMVILQILLNPGLIFTFWFSLISSLAGNFDLPVQERQAPPPNIIFIMTDDHAVQAISSYGGQLIQTPNIDRIGREGIRFADAFVTNSICAPSRAVLLTGKYSHINGLRDNRDRFDGSQVTFPKLLQQSGYQTAIIGKWHLKTAPTGFHHWNVLIDQGDYYNPTMILNGDTVNYTGYTTDVITDLSIEHLEKRDTTKPFCLLYQHKAPHRNWMPKPEIVARFEDRTIPLPATFHDDYATRSDAARDADMRIADMYMSMDMKLFPEDYGKETGTGGSANFDAERNWMENYTRLTPEQKAAWDAHYDPIREEFRKANLSGKELAEWKFQRYLKDYLACVASVDENIGRLLEYLEQKGLAENTIIVYTSDQGFYLGEHGWYDKRFMYEESLRTPLVMRYPKEIPAGQVSNLMALNLDLAPTLLDFAGVAVPKDMQGRSLGPIARGQMPDDWRLSIYYHYYELNSWHTVKKHYGVRTGRYKLIHFYDDIDAWELYDLENDPHEVNNVYGTPAYKDITAELHGELRRLREHYRVLED
jgi:arylsulfatase A-like enzyme